MKGHTRYSIFQKHKDRRLDFRVSPWYSTKAQCWAEAVSRSYVWKDPSDGLGYMPNHYFKWTLKGDGT